MYRGRQCDLRETILKMVVQFDVAMIIALTHDMRLIDPFPNASAPRGCAYQFRMCRQNH